MDVGALFLRQLRAVQRHKGLAAAVFIPLAAAAAWGMLHLPGEYTATAQAVFTLNDVSASKQTLPFLRPTDDMYWDLSQHLGLHPGVFRGYAVYQVRSHSTVAFAGNESGDAKPVTVTFTDKSPDTASAVSFALAKSVSMAISNAWQKQQTPLPPPPVVQPVSVVTNESAPTREEILLKDALQQDEELHAAFQLKAGEWARMRHQLSELSPGEREAMATQLNKQRAVQEEQIIALQKQMVANQKEEVRLKALIANQPREAHTAVSIQAPPPVTNPSQPKAFPWTIAITSDPDIKYVQHSPMPGLLVPAVFLVTFLIVTIVDRFDGTVKSESSLREQLIGSARYAGAIPRIRHETIYR